MQKFIKQLKAYGLVSIVTLSGAAIVVFAILFYMNSVDVLSPIHESDFSANTWDVEEEESVMVARGVCPQPGDPNTPLTESYKSYILNFEGGGSAIGTSAGNNANISVDGHDMTIHVSCSDDFFGPDKDEGTSDDGYGEKGDPTEGDGHPRVTSYQIWKYKYRKGNCSFKDFCSGEPFIERDYDFGDAPDPTYPTLLASDGARHIIGSGLYLGATIDDESDGQPDPAALGDDAVLTDDEDGVTFTSAVVPGSGSTMTVVASSPGFLDAWIDFNGDGSWSEAGDQIYTALPLGAGPNLLVYFVPGAATSNISTFARFRFSSAGSLSYDGLADDGEVEDYVVDIETAVDLMIEKVDASDPVFLATEDIVYILTVTNNGPSDATNVTVTDTLPGGVTFVSAISGQGSCAEVSGVVTCDLGTIVDAASVEITITVSPDSAGVYTNNVLVTSDGHDLNEINNDDEEETTVDPVAGLKIEKVDVKDPVLFGIESIVYLITLTNLGPSDATNVIVTDLLPSGVTYVSSVPSQGDCLEDTGVITCSLGLMALDEVVTIEITVDPDDVGVFANNVSVVADEEDSELEDNDDEEETTVLYPPIFDASTKEDNDVDNEVSRDQVITYTLTLINTGGADATGVDVYDQMDPLLEDLENVTVSNCGGSYTHNSTDNPSLLNIIELEVLAGETCVISWDVSVVPDAQNGAEINNQARISPANEGGVGFEPSSDTLTVVVSPPPPPPPVGDDDDDDDRGSAGGGGGGTSGPPVLREVAEEIEEPEPVVLPACLEYFPLRELIFDDLDLAPVEPVDFGKYINFLKGVRIVENLIGYNQYIISGYGSFEGGNIGTASIGPINPTTRMEAVKIALTSNCVQIYEPGELPLIGVELPDLPRTRYFGDTHDNPYYQHITPADLDFATRVMYSGYDMGIINGLDFTVVGVPLIKAGAPWEFSTRAEIFKIYTNAAGLSPENLKLNTTLWAQIEAIPFSWVDVSPEDWFYEHAKIARYYEIVSDAPFAYPNRVANRAELFVLTTRVMYFVREDLQGEIQREFFNEVFVQELARRGVVALSQLTLILIGLE